MDPGQELSTVGSAASQAAADEAVKRIEDASAVGAQRHRRAKQDLPSAIGRSFIVGSLPCAGDVDAESPR
jgi:hypothetical protein